MGNISPVDIGIGSDIAGVDDNGFITLFRRLPVVPIEYEQPVEEKAYIPKMAVFDCDLNLILDYVIDDIWPAPVIFRDGFAVVRTGASEWYRYSQLVDNNAKYGLIDTKRRFVIEAKYDDVKSLGDGKYSAHSGDTEIIFSMKDFSPKPSSWAEPLVDSAVSRGLVPGSLQYDYNKAISRADFCALAVKLYETVTGSEPEEKSSFSDNCRIDVEKAAALSIVMGIGEGRFSPDSPINREQAAVILSKTASALGRDLPDFIPAFSDNNDISHFAIRCVGQTQGSGIMKGIVGGRFAPKSALSKEQAIVTIYRLYELLLSD